MAQVIAQVQAATGSSFGASAVDVVTFSSGIHVTNQFLSAGAKGLPIHNAYNQDPTSGIPIAGGAARQQFLSGMTTRRPAPGFEYLPMPRWVNEPEHAHLFSDAFNQLHTWCIPQYTLYLGLKLSG